MTSANGFYDIVADMPGGAEKTLPMSSLKGKVVLVVNVASKCGFTVQYTGLEQLYKKYKDQGFEIVGQPCNQFAGQEPGSDEEIAKFCSLTYDVSFPITKKGNVNGADTTKLFEWVKNQKSGFMGLSMVKWNLQAEKFLISRDGQFIERYSSRATPEKIEADIVKALEQPAKL